MFGLRKFPLPGLSILPTGEGGSYDGLCDQIDPAGFKAHPPGGVYLPMIKQGSFKWNHRRDVNSMQGHGRGQVPGWSEHLPERSLNEATVRHSTGCLSKAC